MLANSAVRSLIRDGKVHQIASIIQTGRKFGMKTMNQSLIDLYRDGQIDIETALSHSLDPEDLKRNLQVRSRRSQSESLAEFSTGGR